MAKDGRVNLALFWLIQMINIDQGSKVAATEDFFGKVVLATTPIFAHKIPYDFFFGNRKKLGDIVVSVNLSSINEVPQALSQ
jgi:hypothetical protein